MFREKPKRADYILYLNANNPIAYSSNGDGFAEHDFLTGKERQFGLGEFPTEAELVVLLDRTKLTQRIENESVPY